MGRFTLLLGEKAQLDQTSRAIFDSAIRRFDSSRPSQVFRSVPRHFVFWSLSFLSFHSECCITMGRLCSYVLDRLAGSADRLKKLAETIAEPLVSYQINRQLSGWNPPPLVIRAFGAHCQHPTSRAIFKRAVEIGPVDN